MGSLHQTYIVRVGLPNRTNAATLTSFKSVQ